MKINKTKKNVNKFDIVALEIKKKVKDTGFYLKDSVGQGSNTEVYNFRLNAGEDKVTFAELDNLSTIFKTKKLNVRSETESGGYCDSCAYEEAVCYVDVIDGEV